MHYFLCPSCNNRNDIDNDVTGQQFACGHCGHIQVVAACYYDPPTENVPTVAAIQQHTNQQTPQPQIQYEEPPAVMPTPKPAQNVAPQRPTPKKKKKKKGTMRTTKTIAPQRKGNTKRTRARMPVTQKKQSSPMPLIISISSVVVIIIIACVIFANNKKPKETKQQTTRKTIKKPQPKKTGNIFLDTLEESKYKKRNSR